MSMLVSNPPTSNMSKDLNYFTCTLGQAAQYKETVPEDERSFATVLDLVDKQAEAYGDRPALGFADFTQGIYIYIYPTQFRIESCYRSRCF